MATLSTELRNQLARAIKEARREAEAGARRALEALAVDRHEYFPSMSPEERALRNRLRAHGRQLGDVRERSRGSQEIKRLAHEVAYEHWHRMLFARFLAENHLLLEPDSGVAISMAECEDLARERGEDPWSLASRFAQRMLPAIFRPDDPVLAVTLAPEVRQSLERLLESLPVAVFASDDALGWTYQFWQSERKDEVNASGVKIGADELPAVTQLFTENYMVLFLFHNTIGAWHAAKVLAASPDLAKNAESEDELRRAVRLRSQGGYDFSYLRFVREPQDGDDEDASSGPWRPAAGAFEGWPRTAAELRVLDPCCGSGHFLVEGFELLVRLRMDEDALPLQDAIRAVLAENLHGLEIDARCTQIAAFNLALAAWRLAGRPIELPALNVACSGLAPNATKEQWLALAEQAAAASGMPADRDLFETKDSLLSGRVREGLAALYQLFEKAPDLGSLIDPRSLRSDLFQADFAAVQPLLTAVLEGDRGDAEATERAVAAAGMARATELLAADYTLAITNVPYLLAGKMSATLKKHCSAMYDDSKNDLAFCLLSRYVLSPHGAHTAALVTPNTFLHMKTYHGLRKSILEQSRIGLVARLGSRAFDAVSGEVVRVALHCISHGKPGTDHTYSEVTAEDGQSGSAKATAIRERPIVTSSQAAQLLNPEARFISGELTHKGVLGSFAKSYIGLQTSDNPRFVLQFWEVQEHSEDWRLFQTPTPRTEYYSGRDSVVRWGSGTGDLHEIGQIKGTAAWGKHGIAVRLMSNLPVSLYTGDIFEQSSAVIVPDDAGDLTALWTFLSSEELVREVRRIDQAIKVTNKTFEKIAFDVNHWRNQAAELWPDGLPNPQSNDPTQWLFHGGLPGTDPATLLQVAVARLVGFKWPPERDPTIALAPEARQLVRRSESLEALVDDNGVICLSPLRGRPSGVDRLRALLASTFGRDWTAAQEREVLAAASGSQHTASLDDWLRDRFFEEHCKLFKHRPFIWQIWDGRKDGFHALVNYHRLAAPNDEGRRTLEALTYSYLGDWIQRQRAEQRDGKEGADGRLAAALDLQGQLELILAGEPPYDLFTRWKPLHEQPVGWDPDINDGVRLNIRPFMSAQLRAGGRKGAGILRWKPNITWKKDRGSERVGTRRREDFPWFWSCPGDGSVEERTDFLGATKFDGNRWNDLHYTNAAKNAARARKAQETSS